MKWQTNETAPESTPLNQKFFLAVCPNDEWGPAGIVHFAVHYAHDDPGMCRPYGTNGSRAFTHWMPIPSPPEVE